MSGEGALDLVRLFTGAGQRAYGESVTQLAHALQCAALAHRDHADDEVVVAALLHDVGHLVDCPEDRPERHHGSGGAACPPLIEYAPVLERYFGPQPWTPGPGIDRKA